MEIFLFILGYYVQLFASCVLSFKILKEKSISGLSVDTQISYLLSTCVRIIWVMETRLVETFFAYVELMLSTAAAGWLCYNCYKFYGSTAIGANAPEYLKVYLLAPVAMVLAFFFHPGDDWMSMQVLVAFTIYMEAMALMPQLWLFRKSSFVEGMTSNYVGLLICARFIRMLFWLKMYFLGEHFVQLLLADIAHTVLSADFFMLWFKKLVNGGSIIMSEKISV
jgi:ER lumen protein retaining receptor